MGAVVPFPVPRRSCSACGGKVFDVDRYESEGMTAYTCLCCDWIELEFDHVCRGTIHQVIEAIGKLGAEREP
jgi:hypothetical protein